MLLYLTVPYKFPENINSRYNKKTLNSPKLLFDPLNIKSLLVKTFQFWNNITGWFTFLVATIVYLLTIEPTTSLWDCGEFIATAYKLEVTHPPGAPLFMILARFFSIFASGPETAAKMINALSALASSFTILFLFWTITHLGRKLVQNVEQPSPAGLVAILGAVQAVAEDDHRAGVSALRKRQPDLQVLEFEQVDLVDLARALVGGIGGVAGGRGEREQQEDQRAHGDGTRAQPKRFLR